MVDVTDFLVLHLHQLDLDDERQKLEESLDMKDKEIEELKEDVDQLKKKLVKLIK